MHSKLKFSMTCAQRMLFITDLYKIYYHINIIVMDIEF